MEKNEKMQIYCNIMNTVIKEDGKHRTELLNEVMKRVYADGGCLYWHRDVFISCGGDDKKMKDLVKYSDNVHFEPSDDPQEHPGVTVHYNKTNETL